jgi:hypothetical protein
MTMLFNFGGKKAKEAAAFKAGQGSAVSVKGTTYI